MSLLTFDVPDDMVGHIQDVVREDKECVASIQDPEKKQETLDRIQKLEDFLKFIESPLSDTKTDSINISPLQVEGPGSSANLMILEAFRIHGEEQRLDDPAIIKKLRKSLYHSDEKAAEKSYFVLKQKEGLYEWWEKGEETWMDELRGLVKTEKFQP